MTLSEIVDNYLTDLNRDRHYKMMETEGVVRRLQRFGASSAFCLLAALPSWVEAVEDKNLPWELYYLTLRAEAGLNPRADGFNRLLAAYRLRVNRQRSRHE